MAATAGFDVPACVRRSARRGDRGRQRRCVRPRAVRVPARAGGRAATLREVSVVIAVLLAREHPGPIGWAGIGAVVAGAVLAAA